jgi:hypothetical protein
VRTGGLAHNLVKVSRLLQANQQPAGHLWVTEPGRASGLQGQPAGDHLDWELGRTGSTYTITSPEKRHAHQAFIRTK